MGGRHIIQTGQTPGSNIFRRRHSISLLKPIGYIFVQLRLVPLAIQICVILYRKCLQNSVMFTITISIVVQCTFNMQLVSYYSLWLYPRLLARFAPIFYFNCEHVLFVFIVKQNEFADFKKNFRGFSKFKKLMKIEFFKFKIF